MNSRCMFHHFDPDTHRCTKCDRWAPGFAPKKVRVGGEAECQICERAQALKKGELVMHGYKRPGHGWLVGKCMGTHHRPFPATDALEAYLTVVSDYLAGRREYLAALPTYDEFDVVIVKRDWRSKQETSHPYKVRRGDRAFFDAEKQNNVPSFEGYFEQRMALTQRDIEQAEREVKRVTARIAKGKAAQK